jgi:hypothetical protein
MCSVGEKSFVMNLQRGFNVDLLSSLARCRDRFGDTTHHFEERNDCTACKRNNKGDHVSGGI